MPTLELIELYPSPWSERLRWVLELKGVPYRRTPYVPLAGQDEHKGRTGIATAPVLIADEEIVGDSDRAVDWLEARHPSPALLPDDPRRRAQVRAWELYATEVLAPAGRLLMIGRLKAMNVQPIADYFATKYHWDEAEEGRVGQLLGTALPELAAAVATSPYLVGDAFTRADLTLAALLTPVLGLPADDLFAIDPGTRMMFSSPLGADPALAPLADWRERTYRAHRGGRVEPPTS
ncbi:MAG TPA: glutathione S-transferase family protein [Candidatus Binatia bacterium]|jgi:glutathione S-transferase|nr:glutathione S-transferase family protein [Candidatus Binatia bacterium]